MRIVGAAVLTLMLAAALPAAAAPAAPAAPRLAKPVITALQEANKQVAAKNFEGALAAALQAQAAAAAPYDKSRVDEMLAFVYSQLRNYTAAADANAALLASGFVDPAQVRGRSQAICQLRDLAKEWDKAIAACTSFAQQYNDRATWYRITQFHIQQQNFDAAAKLIRSSIVGDPMPPKPLLLQLGSCYYKLKDMDGVQWSYEQLVVYYPQSSYWSELLGLVQQKTRNNLRFDLDILRLRAATGVIEVPNELVDLAATAMQVGLPGEAKSVLERALAAQQIGSGTDKATHMQAVAQARQQAGEDLRSLAKDEAEAKKAPKGEADLRIGEGLVSHGRVADGIAAMQRGIAKGGLKDPIEASLRLGLAQLQAGNKEEALKSLDAATGNTPFATIARLWGIQVRNSMRSAAAAPADDAEPADEEEPEEETEEAG